MGVPLRGRGGRERRGCHRIRDVITGLVLVIPVGKAPRLTGWDGQHEAG
jgi:hypothetical protein